MFGGRKWNPLRSRYDSGDFSWDQLCVGMFIFSSLLLLLPTLLVYYVVFLAVWHCLRIVLQSHYSIKPFLRNYSCDCVYCFFKGHSDDLFGSSIVYLAIRCYSGFSDLHRWPVNRIFLDIYISGY